MLRGRGQGPWGRGGRRGLETSGSLLRTRAPCRGAGEGGGVKCAGGDTGWKRDFTSPLCSLAGSISTHSLFLPLPCRSPARVLTRPSLLTITSAVPAFLGPHPPPCLTLRVDTCHSHPVTPTLSISGPLGCFPGDRRLRRCLALRASFPELSPAPGLAAPHQAPGTLGLHLSRLLALGTLAWWAWVICPFLFSFCLQTQSLPFCPDPPHTFPSS